MTTVTKRIILDTDIGDDIDDAYALALALESPRIELAAVLAGGGRVEQRALTARRLIRLAGHEIPVFCGSDAGAARALDYRLAGEDDRARVPRLDEAVDDVRAIVRAGPATLVCIGGLTNAAWLLDALEPDERRRLELVVMGGSFTRDYTGAAGAAREGNIVRDVPAARRVLERGARVTLVPVDATWDLALDADRLRLAHDPGTALGPALADLYAQWRDAYGYPCPVLHDPFTLALAVDGSLARLEEFPVTVDAAGYTRRAPSGTPCRVALAGDRDAFMQWFEETLLVPARAAR